MGILPGVPDVKAITDSFHEELAEIRKLLERLVEIEEGRAAGEKLVNINTRPEVGLGGGADLARNKRGRR